MAEEVSRNKACKIQRKYSTDAIRVPQEIGRRTYSLTETVVPTFVFYLCIFSAFLMQLLYMTTTDLSCHLLIHSVSY